MKTQRTFTEQESEAIKRAFEITQGISINEKKNFVCPICGVNRIKKAHTSKSHKDEWNHAGCVCTNNYLDLTGALLRSYK